MKSNFDDRDTIGTMLLNTHEKHLKDSSFEVGEIVDQFGKKYMSDLLDYIEEGSKKFDKFYINILSRKTKLYLRRAIEVFPYIMPKLPLMQPNQDVWFIDCIKQKIELLWTLPDEDEFDVILSNPCKDNEDLIKWIKIYKDLKKKRQKAS